MTEANPTGLDIPDGEIECIKSKLIELEDEMAPNKWENLKMLLGEVRAKLEKEEEEEEVLATAWLFPWLQYK